jgi:hypothetical protein
LSSRNRICVGTTSRRWGGTVQRSTKDRAAAELFTSGAVAKSRAVRPSALLCGPWQEDCRTCSRRKEVQ